jgi:serine/threonine protein kinase
VKPVLIDQAPALGSTEEQSQLQPGLQVADTYRLIEQLGAGSMGTVWKAQHTVLGHNVAIKFLRASLDAYPQGRFRFEREGKLAARLGEESRHICRVTDYGVMSTGTPFVVMELLQGEELARLIKRERTLPLSLVAEIVTQLCRALAVAHRAGVVHRDLKPANVFLCSAEDGKAVFVKLLDFGVAHAPLEDDTEGTRAGVVFGTPGYTSPEQISGEQVDGRADLWSVAVIAYRMATGRTPFGGGAIHEIGMRILTVDPPAPSSLQPELPAAFDAWIAKALAKRREERFATALELSDALQATCSAPPRDSPVRSGLRRALRGETPRSKRAAWAAVSGGALALLVLIAWAARPSSPRSARPDAPPHHPAAAGAPRPSAPSASAPAPESSRAAAPGARAPYTPAPRPEAPRDPNSSAPGERPISGLPGASALQVPLAPPISHVLEAPLAPAAPSPLALDPSAPQHLPTSPAPTLAAERRRERAARRDAQKRAPAADPLKTRAAELWNKTDEL